MKEKTVSLNVNGDNIKIKSYYPTDRIDEIILFCHGFPGNSRLPELAPSLKNRLVVEINYKGDKGCEGKFSFLGSITDVISTVTNYIRKTKYRNVPITALGYSMGSFYTLYATRGKPTLFNKVILLNPVVDTKALFSNELLMEELWESARNILSLEVPLFYKMEIELINRDLNPMDFASKLKIPISIVQSTDDEVLSPEIAEEFYHKLNCEKKFFKIPGGKHDLKGNEKQLLKAICG